MERRTPNTRGRERSFWPLAASARPLFPRRSQYNEDSNEHFKQHLDREEKPNAKTVHDHRTALIQGGLRNVPVCASSPDRRPDPHLRHHRGRRRGTASSRLPRVISPRFFVNERGYAAALSCH